MELRDVSWQEVMVMPYSFFIDDLKWKTDLNKKRREAQESAERKRQASMASVRANKLRHSRPSSPPKH